MPAKRPGFKHLALELEAPIFSAICLMSSNTKDVSLFVRVSHRVNIYRGNTEVNNWINCVSRLFAILDAVQANFPQM